MEQLDLTSPQSYTVRSEVSVSANSYRVTQLLLDWTSALIQARVVDDRGVVRICTWEGATATTLMTALNKANLTNNSLHRRVLERAATDGFLPAGSVTGNPD